MKIYIQFENRKQVQAGTYNDHPGKNWKEAPKNFSWGKLYRLDEKGTVVELQDEELRAEELENAKFGLKRETKHIAGRFRETILSTGDSKSEEYRIKTEAARNIIELARKGGKVNAKNIHYQVLILEAEAREMDIVSLANVIVQKNEDSLLAIGQVAAFEVKAKKLIDDANDLDLLYADLQELTEETKEKFRIEEL